MFDFFVSKKLAVVAYVEDSRNWVSPLYRQSSFRLNLLKLFKLSVFHFKLDARKIFEQQEQ